MADDEALLKRLQNQSKKLTMNTKGRGPSKSGLDKFIKGKAGADKQTVKEINKFKELENDPEYLRARQTTEARVTQAKFPALLKKTYMPNETKKVLALWDGADNDRRQAATMLFSDGDKPELDALIEVLR